jgi:hypothetical protein
VLPQRPGQFPEQRWHDGNYQSCGEVRAISELKPKTSAADKACARDAHAWKGYDHASTRQIIINLRAQMPQRRQAARGTGKSRTDFMLAGSADAIRMVVGSTFG